MPRRETRKAVTGKDQAMRIMFAHGGGKGTEGFSDHFIREVVALAAGIGCAEGVMHFGAVVFGIQKVGMKGEFVTEFPSPDGRVIAIASHHLADIMAHPGLGFTVWIGPLIHRFTHQIRHAGVIPK